MTHILKVRLNSRRQAKSLMKLNELGITLKNINYQKDYIEGEVSLKDYKKIKKYLVSLDVLVIEEVGYYKIKKKLQKNLLYISSIIFGICLFFVLSIVIIDVNIIHENKEIRELLESALRERGVERLTFKKSYQEYENIIESIKEEYKDRIEWLEIDVEGMVINVRVEQRIINTPKEEYGTCHIVASKSGIIRSLLTKKGVSLVHIGDYVNKGDILISGEVKLNEEVKNNVCANGEVYAEVWYTVSASYPLEYADIKRTGKMRYNFSHKKNGKVTSILRSRVKTSEKEYIPLLNILNNKFYLVKEYEITKEIKTYTEEEALEKAKETIYEKLKTNKIEIANIINEKVLKKSVNNGKLNIVMFFAVKEQVGVVEYYNIETERGTNDANNNGDNKGIN